MYSLISMSSLCLAALQKYLSPDCLSTRVDVVAPPPPDPPPPDENTNTTSRPKAWDTADDMDSIGVDDEDDDIPRDVLVESTTSPVEKEEEEANFADEEKANVSRAIMMSSNKKASKENKTMSAEPFNICLFR